MLHGETKDRHTAQHQLQHLQIEKKMIPLKSNELINEKGVNIHLLLFYRRLRNGTPYEFATVAYRTGYVNVYNVYVIRETTH